MNRPTASDIQNNFYQAMEIIAQNAISKAGYDRTIIAHIKSHKESGEYSLRYQDAIITAFSDNIDIIYPEGTEVYVLIPGGDFSKNKKIVGTVRNLGEAYFLNANQQTTYNINGVNCIEQDNIDEVFALKSYEGKTITLFDVNEPQTNKLIIDQKSFETYVDGSTDIQIAAEFKNLFNESEQIVLGDYGITIELDFINENDNSIITRICTLATDNMNGNPYKIHTFRNYSNLYNIGKHKFKQIKSIKFFAKNFGPSNNIEDIFVKNIQLYALTGEIEEVSDFALKLETPKGLFLSEGLKKSEVIINANVLHKNRPISGQGLETYWFIEDASITTTSLDYNPYGGQGWRCLNNFTLISNGSNQRKNWFSDSSRRYEISASKQNIPTTYSSKYKCVCVFEDVVLQEEVEIINENAQYVLSLISSGGTLFKSDKGLTEITCTTKGVQDQNKLTYKWNSVDSSGVVSEIKTNDDKVNSITVEVKDIYNKKRIVCSVYSEENLLGTTSIELIKIIAADENQDYILTAINNNGYVFKYDAHGRSPASTFNASPIQIHPLSFKLYSKEGKEITDEIMTYWQVPINNTMLKAVNVITAEDVEENPNLKETPTANGYYIFTDKELKFAIKDYYNHQSIDNTIILQATYQGTVFTTNFTFNFIKDGMAGTNGTDFYCDIQLAEKTNQEGYPILFFYRTASENNEKLITDYKVNFNYKQLAAGGDDADINGKKWFSATLYKQGVPIEGTEASPLTWKWSILKDKMYQDSPEVLEIDEDGICHFIPGDIDETTGLYKSNYIHPNSKEGKIPNFLLVQAEATYGEKKYYGVFPVAYAFLDKLNWTCKIEGGCQEIVYASDGSNPEYSHQPFKVSVKEKDGGWIDLQTIPHQIATFSTDDFTFDYKNQEQQLVANYYYDGRDTYQQIYFKATAPSIELYFPLYFHLNKYGHTAINGWNGNSVELNDEEIILAPQMGAGHKTSNNSFTGLVMGTVKNINTKETPEATGLFGYNDGKQTFCLDATDGSVSFGENKEIQITPAAEGGEAVMTIAGWNVAPDAFYRGVNALGIKNEDEDNGEQNINNIYLGKLGFSLGDSLIFKLGENPTDPPEFTIKGKGIEWDDTDVTTGTFGGWTIRNGSDGFDGSIGNHTAYLRPANKERVIEVGTLYITNEGKLYLQSNDNTICVNDLEARIAALESKIGI